MADLQGGAVHKSLLLLPALEAALRAGQRSTALCQERVADACLFQEFIFGRIKRARRYRPGCKTPPAGRAGPPLKSCPACSSSSRGRAARTGPMSGSPTWGRCPAGRRQFESWDFASRSGPVPCGSCPARSSRTWHRPQPRRTGSSPRRVGLRLLQASFIREEGVVRSPVLSRYLALHLEVVPQDAQHRADEVLLQLGLVVVLQDARLALIKLLDGGKGRPGLCLPPLCTVHNLLFQIVVGEQIAVLERARVWRHPALGLARGMIKVSKRANLGWRCKV
jgi:hypothetical protein